MGVPSALRAERRDPRFETDDAFGRALRPGERVDVVAVAEVAELQHPVDGAADTRAVSTSLPGRQLDVDRLLVESGIVGGADRLLVRMQFGREPCRRDPRTSRRDSEDTAPLLGPAFRIAPVEFERRRGGAVDGPAVELADSGSGGRPGRTTVPEQLGRRQLALVGAVGVALRRRRPVQRHDEVIDRARAGHIEQSAALGVAHLLVDRQVVDEHAIVALAGQHPGVVDPHHTGGLAASWSGGQAGHDRDRELEALGGVDGHQADRVVVVFGQDRVGDPALRRLERGPVEVAPQPVATGVGPRASLLDDVPQAAPHVAGVAAGEGEVEDAPLVGDGGEQIGGRDEPRPLGDRTDVGDGVGNGVALEALGRRCPQPPGAARRRPLPQFDVAAAVERRAQRCDERQAVGGVVGGPQREQQRPHLGRGVHHRGVLGPVRQVGVAELRLERRQGGPGREQHADVAGDTRPERAERFVEHRPSVGEGGGDGGHDVARLDRAQGVGGAHLRVTEPRFVVVEQRDVDDLRAEDGDRAVAEQVCPAARVERTERRLGVGLVRDQPTEHVVDQVDDRGRGAEVGGEVDLVGADLVGRAEVLRDVGAAEPVDRLLRVADDEQPTGHRHELAPVVRPGPDRRGAP